MFAGGFGIFRIDARITLLQKMRRGITITLTMLRPVINVKNVVGNTFAGGCIQFVHGQERLIPALVAKCLSPKMDNMKKTVAFECRFS